MFLFNYLKHAGDSSGMGGYDVEEKAAATLTVGFERKVVCVPVCELWVVCCQSMFPRDKRRTN